MIRHPIIANTMRSAAVGLARIAPDFFAGKLTNPYFIIGCPRSGTTLLLDSIANHYALAQYPGEANELWHPQTFPWMYSKHRDRIPPQEVDPEQFTRLSLEYRTPSEVRLIRASFGAYQLLRAKDVFLNKSAMTVFMIPFVLEQFPEGKFIYIYRDGRSVALSWAKMQYRKVQNNFDLYSNHGFSTTYANILQYCARSWHMHIEEIERQKDHLRLVERGLIHEVRYEDFCADPKTHLKGIAQFMGISPAPYINASYAHVRDKDYKFKGELAEDVQQDLVQTMEPALRSLSYL